MKICVYGAASSEIDKSFLEAGEELGRQIVERGHGLVFGGGANGMMGAVARGVDSKGGYILGIAPGFFNVDGVSYDNCTEFIHTDTMRERKREMEENGEAFIITPGGIGTLDEFFEILTLTLKSGRNLEQSLRVTCDNVDSEISDEFKKALFEMDFGKSLMEALEDMKKRIPSESINNIILNITQTSQFGNSILETMYNQIDFLREKKILDIKGKINKIPNKVSIISVIFIVPLIMILILGPYLIDFIS